MSEVGEKILAGLEDAIAITKCDHDWTPWKRAMTSKWKQCRKCLAVLSRADGTPK